VNATTRIVAIILGLWFVVALAVGASGLYYAVPTPVVGATNALLVTLTLLAVFLIPRLRAWVSKVPLQWLVLYHVVRFVGIAFLVFEARGLIPAEFALTAGWGDIAVAVTALIVAFRALPIANRTHWWVVLLWNVFGLLDILIVLRKGIALGLADPAQMVWITAFPWSLIPTFIVPLVLVTHILIFVRLRELSRRTPRAPESPTEPT
jgi:hypothetical protein